MKDKKGIINKHLLFGVLDEQENKFIIIEHKQDQDRVNDINNGEENTQMKLPTSKLITSKEFDMKFGGSKSQSVLKI